MFNSFATMGTQCLSYQMKLLEATDSTNVTDLEFKMKMLRKQMHKTVDDLTKCDSNKLIPTLFAQKIKKI
jgi:hypothetical protein